MDVVARYTRALAITPLEVLVARHELIEDVAVSEGPDNMISQRTNVHIS